jgi:hypothetical protein
MGGVNGAGIGGDSTDSTDAAAGDSDSTNAMGSSNVDPGRLLVSIETRPSPIGDALDMLTKSCDCLELSSCSVLDIHRMIDAAV